MYEIGLVPDLVLGQGLTQGRLVQGYRNRIRFVV
jgi:hypothetical protein